MSEELPKPVSASEIARIRESIPEVNSPYIKCDCGHADSDHLLYDEQCYVCSCDRFVSCS